MNKYNSISDMKRNENLGNRQNIYDKGNHHECYLLKLLEKVKKK